jgi:hypothetical protein
MKLIKTVLAINLVLFGSGPVYAVDMPESATRILKGMTPERARSIVSGFTSANSGHGMPCLIGIGPATRLEPGQPVTVEKSQIRFAGYYGKYSLADTVHARPLSSVDIQKLLNDGTIEKSTVDLAGLKKIRMIRVNAAVRSLCSGVQSGHLVVLQPKNKLPKSAELVLNAASPEELDKLLAALKYFSPKAKLKGKI